MSIRKVGAGKFENVMDEYVYGGFEHDSVGDVNYLGYAALVQMTSGAFEEILRQAEDAGDSLTDAEIRKLESSAGAIWIEDTDGFVTVKYYRDPDKLEEAWGWAQEEYGGEDEDED